MTGVVAVGDSDEYDDLASAKFNASLSTPAFSLDGVAAGYGYPGVRLKLGGRSPRLEQYRFHLTAEIRSRWLTLTPDTIDSLQ